ncbi:ATP-binding cassette domain-containing protein [Propionimicrobium sp. PCR01-08-3]|uniref:ABC transporter ATP-binding protein n=1 Tax=Propionimicrobium sp. PCR01-08-3 TaxID=3052086 RepID=UPI00255CD83C|nr:ATP-binding cassette domain-containing protein [Propionimicrobium sp. PCR01-08-3]WIY83455.1 ATP-binding cassette domain-containing protein [Propionimicrobium sp. PCR01-08-3]
MTDAIEVVGLTKAYREPVLTGLDLTVRKGVVALLGANGAGKTTLISILTTLIRPDAGTARICGADVVRDAVEVRRRIAVTGQQTTLDDMLTGRENLVMLGRLLGLGRSAGGRADELIDRFGLMDAASRVVSTYSGGMRRRLDLAASLVSRPTVLFLDEPTTGLDPTSRRLVWNDVRALAAGGTTVLLTTQMLDEAEALADRIVVLRRGRLVADGTASELAALVGGQRLVLSDAEGRQVRSIETDGSAASVGAAVAALGDEERQLHINLRQPSLDDAFVALTAGDREVAA